MPDQLEKLRPDRDLQCFFFQPSAIAAMSSASASGFTLSGTWRQQFDWAVIEWNRDNVYEHPAFRNLPDGDLSGLMLAYDEIRTNCIALDSELFATVDWPSLRVWATPPGGTETIYYIPLKAHATAIQGSYSCAYADFTLSGTAVGGDVVGLAILGEHYTYQLYGTDDLSSTVAAIRDSVNAFSQLMKAEVLNQTTIRLYYTASADKTVATTGANGNRFGVYSYSTGSSSWDSPAKTFSNGTSPTKWRITIPFGSLQGTITPDLNGALYNVPTQNTRKIRWTYGADLQAASFQRSEFEVVVSNWTVTGSNRGYSVAGPGSLRIEDRDAQISYQGNWQEYSGNYSGGSIHRTSTAGDSLTCSYSIGVPHDLYLGLRYLGNGALATIQVDGAAVASVNLSLAGEDTLFRYRVSNLPGGDHTVNVSHGDTTGTDLWFDFLEAAVVTSSFSAFPSLSRITAATDWDTLHSISIAPERTAWVLNSLGFRGRANHYIGALWFYELYRPGHQYASGTVTFSGSPDPNYFVTLRLGRVGQSTAYDTVLQRLIHMGDTAATIATSFAQEINRGYTGMWASASGGTLTIMSRSMGADGNLITLTASTTSSNLTVNVPTGTLSGGADGIPQFANDPGWRTDLAAVPRMNRAARDWTASYYAALRDYGLDVVSAFSTELQHGDMSVAAGLAQRGPDGDAIYLPTPAVQTNFSPTSLAFWQEVHKEAAAIHAAAGLTPFLQFGEVQWWYFANNGYPAGNPQRVDYSGMPFYDSWTQSQFQAEFGRSMAVITSNAVDPASYPDEVSFLSSVLGSFTSAAMSYVLASFPNCRFEVLYPKDVNESAFNSAINYPRNAWTPSVLTVLKTESFGYTFGHNLNKSAESIAYGESLGFGPQQRSHLIGVGDVTAAWQKELYMALGKGFESVVLWALDQFCLIGYDLPFARTLRRSIRVGGG
jgi:hypothetical protein